MVRKTYEEQLLEVDQEIKDKAAKRNRIRQKIRKQQKAIHTTRMILIGDAISNLVKTGEWKKEKMLHIMDGYLIKDEERILFDLHTKQNQ